MGSLWDLGTLEIMNSGAGLLFVDIPPEILAEEKEGMISESVPRTSAPLSLTPHPGTVLPALALPTEALHLGQDAEWQPHQHQQPRVASVHQGHPQAARLLSGSLPIVQRKQPAKVCECKKKEFTGVSHTSQGPVSVLSLEPLRASLTFLTIPVNSSSLH